MCIQDTNFILVEDPSDDFIRLRDFVDVQNSLKLLECFSSADKLRSGFSDNMVKEANEKLKLCKRQTRRVYEIVRLHWTKKSGPLNDDNTEYKEYRVDIKKRLNIPFQVYYRLFRKILGAYRILLANQKKLC